jgi:hypothetical protein
VRSANEATAEPEQPRLRPAVSRQRTSTHRGAPEACLLVPGTSWKWPCSEPAPGHRCVRLRLEWQAYLLSASVIRLRLTHRGNSLMAASTEAEGTSPTVCRTHNDGVCTFGICTRVTCCNQCHVQRLQLFLNGELQHSAQLPGDRCWPHRLVHRNRASANIN